MREFRGLLYGILLGLCLSACNSTKSAKSSAQEQVVLKKAVYELVDCLNTRDEACLQRLYANDFASYAPVIEFSSVPQLVKKTVRNFEKNQFQVSINVLDMEIGSELAYVALEWELMEKQTNGALLSLLIEKRLDIWKKDNKIGWQLHRSLFYKPRTF